MSQLDEALQELARSRAATMTPPLDDLVRRARRRRTVRLAALGTSLSLATAVSLIAVTDTGSRQTLGTVSAPAGTAVEPRPYKTYQAPYPERVWEGRAPDAGEVSKSEEWDLLGVSEDGTMLVVQADLEVGCGAARIVDVETTNDSVTVTVSHHVGLITAACAAKRPLQITLPEPLSDRALLHAPVGAVSRQTPLHASTPEWANEGTRLLAEGARYAAGVRVAAQSLPVDLPAGSGTYPVSFKVDRSFALGMPMGLRSPEDLECQVRLSPPFKLTNNADGTQTLTAQITIQDNPAAYPAFTAWLTASR